MVTSWGTVEYIYRVMRKHLSSEKIDALLEDLVQISGNQSFRHTMQRLLDRHEEYKEHEARAIIHANDDASEC